MGDQHVRPHPDVVDTELEADETVLLHLGSTTYYSLNPTGTCIWQGLKQGLSLREVSQRLQGRFAVEAEHASESVRTFVDELIQHQLVQLQDG
ncbi:MAG TPA: PqqD family protein [Candidatus Tectomicrobia bacterium]